MIIITEKAKRVINLKNKKSAKDIAFDKERAKYRQEINNLNRILREKQREIDSLKTVIVSITEEKDYIIKFLDNKLEYILKLSNLSREELEKLMEDESRKAESLKSISTAIGIIGFGKSGIRNMDYNGIL